MAPLATPSGTVGTVTADTAAQVATAAFVVGGGAGHLVTRVVRRRQATRDIMQGLVWSVGGRPANELGPAQPGLIQLVQNLTEQVGDLQGWTRQHDEFHRRPGHEREVPQEP